MYRNNFRELLRYHQSYIDVLLKLLHQYNVTFRHHYTAAKRQYFLARRRWTFDPRISWGSAADLLGLGVAPKKGSQMSQHYLYS